MQSETGSHNQRLEQLLERIKSAIAKAEGEDALVEAINEAKSFKGALKFDNRIPILAALVSGVGGLGLGYVLLTEHVAHKGAMITGVILLVLAMVIALHYAFSRSSNIGALSDKAFIKDVLQDNAISPLDYDKNDYASLLKRDFCEFDRGNSSREVRAVYTGAFQGEHKEFTYRLIHFHYVNSRTETNVTTNAQGGTSVSTRTVYDHYDRYGVIVNFLYARDIGVSADMPSRKYPQCYRPASIAFNSKYKVHAAKEQEAARFMKPSVVVAFEQLAMGFEDPSIEINDAGELCITVKDEDLFSLKREHGIDNPDAFITELRRKHRLEKLNTLLGFIEDLKRYSDNNFG